MYNGVLKLLSIALLSFLLCIKWVSHSYPILQDVSACKWIKVDDFHLNIRMIPNAILIAQQAILSYLAKAGNGDGAAPLKIDDSARGKLDLPHDCAIDWGFSVWVNSHYLEPIPAATKALLKTF